MFGAITAAIVHVIGSPLLIAIALGVLPIAEVKGAAIYAFSVGQPWLIIPAAITNIVACLLILLLWDIINVPYWGRLILGQSLEKRLLDFGKDYESRGSSH